MRPGPRQEAGRGLPACRRSTAATTLPDAGSPRGASGNASCQGSGEACQPPSVGSRAPEGLLACRAFVHCTKSIVRRTKVKDIKEHHACSVCHDHVAEVSVE